MPDIRNAAALYIDTADKFAQVSINHADYMRHIVSHFAAERMKHVKHYQKEALSNYRAGGPVRREYPHDAGMAGKTKATTKGSPVEIKEIKRITNYAMSVAGGQGYQPGGRFLVAFNRRGYFSTKSSRANRFCGCFFTPGRGVNSSGSDISLARFSSSWRSSMRCKSCLRCSAKISVMDWYFLFMLLPCKAMRRSTSHHGADSDYSDSLALRRWRYSTSRFNAAVTNCPVLSPGIFTASTLFITSCGTLAATVCDFAFTAFVAMLSTPHKKQMQYAGKKTSVQHLTCLTPRFKLVFNTLFRQGVETTKPRTVGAVTGLLTNNVNEEPLWLP
ncbi:icd-like protein [Escherichia coli]